MRTINIVHSTLYLTVPGIDEQSESSVARSDRSQTEASSIDLEWEHEAGITGVLFCVRHRKIVNSNRLKQFGMIYTQAFFIFAVFG